MRLDFSFYKIDYWLPAEWPEHDEDYLHIAVDRLILEGSSLSSTSYKPITQQTRIDLMRAAACLFWHVFEEPERFTRGQLQEAVEAWQYEYEPNEALNWTRAHVSTNVTGALAIHLYRTEVAFSAAIREAIHNITKLATYLKATNSLIEPGVYYVDDPKYFNETVLIRKSLPIACSLGWCFDFYIAKADGKPEQAFDSAVKAFEAADVAHSVRTFDTEPLAAIEQEYATLALVAMWMSPQDVAEVFEQIHKAVESKADWAQLAFQCDQMGFHYERALEYAEENRFHINRYVDSKIGKFQSESGGGWSSFYPLSEYWAFARGLCITRLSPDAYWRRREEDERHAAQERLKKYFFSDLWNLIPQESQDALITADRIYWSPEGRKGDILENLRLAIEPIIEKQLATPFRAWSPKLEKKTTPNSQEGEQKVFLRLSKLLHELWGKDNRRLFEDFAGKAFPDVQNTFWNELRESLYNLRDLRGASTHPEGREPITTDQALEQYRLFVGIGNRGIIPGLLKLRPRQS